MGFYSITQFDTVLTATFKEFMQKNMFFLVNSFWVSLWTCILHVLSFISRYLLRFSMEKTVKNGSDFDDVCEEETAETENLVESTDEKKNFDQINEKEISKIDTEVGSVCNVGTSKYEFFAGSSVCAFIEEPQIMNFTLHEAFVITNEVSSPRKYLVHENDSLLEESFPVDLKAESIRHDDHIVAQSHISENDFSDGLSGEKEVVELDKIDSSVCGDHELINIDSDDFSGEISREKEGKTEDSVCDRSCENHELGNVDFDDLSRLEEVVDVQEKAESFVFSLCSDEQEVSSISQDDLSEKDEILSPENGIQEKVQVSDQFQSSIANSDDFWSSIHKFDCYIGNHDEFDYDSDEISNFKVSGDQRVDYDEDSPISLAERSFDGNNCQLDDTSTESECSEADSQYIELEPEPYSDPTVHTGEHVPKGVAFNSDDELDQESSNFDSLKGIDASESCDEGDNNQMGDVLLEQKELIRQMKKEMRQLKINGLPTILEESESPRVEDDLRPLRIDEKIGHKGRMDEIQTFYKRYLDKMRKLDILSQQTMYAIGLLQLKYQDQLALNKKVSVPAIKSLLAQNFWSHKLRKHEAGPIQKLIRDFRSELELVYVGQLCLSWEILKWQHHKLEELKTHDPDGFRQYNQGAGDFQKFQVLLQRFTEDEPYHQGPRVQHYLKSRCAHPNLLQVPLIKEDPKSEWRGDGGGAISVGTLKEVIAASMRSFWDFLHADKDEVHVVHLIGLHGVHVDLQDPSDSELLTEIRSSLQKKEKRLKDLIRSGNCLVRKFQKHQDQRLSHEMFLAQVELRLVSRVLNMSKLTTDQLLWCHKKINRINIIGRKVYIESSFLLFPC